MGANAVHAVHSEQLGAEIPIWNGCRLLETHPAGPLEIAHNVFSATIRAEARNRTEEGRGNLSSHCKVFRKFMPNLRGRDF